MKSSGDVKYNKQSQIWKEKRLSYETNFWKYIPAQKLKVSKS